MDNYKFLEEYLKNEINKIEINISQMQKELDKYKPLQNVIDELENDPSKINTLNLNNILSEFMTKEEAETICEMIETIKETQSFFKDPDLEGTGLTEQIIELTKKIKAQLQRYYDSQHIKILNKNPYLIKEYTKRKEQLESQLKLFENGKLNRALSKIETENLFEELEKSNLDKRVVLELMRDITKYNIEHTKVIEEIKSNLLESKIDKNALVVREILEGQGEVKEQQKEESITEIIEKETSEITDLSPEENDILNKINSLIVRKSQKLSVDIEILCKRLAGNFTLEDRIKLYIKDNKYNWPLIAEDLKNNLIPNLNQNKEQIFEIFKHILSYIEKEEQIKKQSDELKEKLKEQKVKIQEIFEQNKNIIEEYKKLTERELNERRSVYSLIKVGKIEELMPKDYNKVNDIIFTMSLYPELVELEKLIGEEITNEIVSISNYEFLINEANNLLEQYNKMQENQKEKIELLTKQIDELKEEEEKSQEQSVQSNIRGYDLKNTKNILLVLKTDGDIPCFDKDLKKEKQETNAKKNAITKTIDAFERFYYNSEYKSYYNNIQGNNSDGKVFYITSSGKRAYDEEMSPRRHWPPGKGRVCYINIPICKENLQKLYSIYRNPNFLIDDHSNKTFVILLVGVGIVKGVSHDDYDDFNKHINHNRHHIRALKSLFANPNTDIEILKRIIEDSAEICKEYTTPEGLNPGGRGRK